MQRPWPNPKPWLFVGSILAEQLRILLARPLHELDAEGRPVRAGPRARLVSLWFLLLAGVVPLAVFGYGTWSAFDYASRNSERWLSALIGWTLHAFLSVLVLPYAGLFAASWSTSRIRR